MIATILGLIGFLTTSGAFGAQVIGAASLMEYWFWFTSILVTILAVLVVVASTIGGGVMGSDLGKVGATLGVTGGGLFGVLLGSVMVASQYALLWMSNYIQSNTDSTAVNWDALSSNVHLAIIGTSIILVIGFLRSLGSKG